MKYIFKKENEEIEATPERWGWAVIYKNGAELHQFQDVDETFHQFQEIKQEETEMFVMYQLEDHSKRVDMVTESKQIFHFYRNIVLAMLTPDERKVKIYVFGWKDKETGLSNYNYILPDDRIVVADHDIDISKFNI